MRKRGGKNRRGREGEQDHRWRILSRRALSRNLCTKKEPQKRQSLEIASWRECCSLKLAEHQGSSGYDLR